MVGVYGLAKKKSRHNEERFRALLSRQKKEVIDSIMLMTTYACQFDCSYCEVQRSEAIKSGSINMPDRVARSAILYLSTSKAQVLQLRFFGGEPLIRFGFIKKAVEFAVSLGGRNGKRYRFCIVTNGLLLNERKLDYLSRFNAHVMFSIDGALRTQLKYRAMKKNMKYAYKQIERNLILLINSRIDYFINMLIVPDNLDNFVDDVIYLVNMGVKKIQICYRVGVFWESQAINKLIYSLGRVLSIVAGMKRKVTILNFYNQAEPVVVKNEIIVDCSGRVYIDPAIFMERRFSALRKTYYIGPIEELGMIDELTFSEADLFDRFLGSYPVNSKERRLLLNNLHLGLVLKKFFQSLPSAIK